MRKGVYYDFPTGDPALGRPHAIEVDFKRLICAIRDYFDAEKRQSGSFCSRRHAG